MRRKPIGWLTAAGPDHRSGASMAVQVAVALRLADLMAGGANHVEEPSLC
jgi:hypothetical protein